MTAAMRQAKARIAAEKNPTNTGHGHVVPRKDRSVMRCGGPCICDTCAKEHARYSTWHAIGLALVAELESRDATE